MVASVEALAPESRCVEVVPLQQRPPHHWVVLLFTWVAIFALVFILGTTYYPDGPPWFASPVIFLSLMAVQISGTSYWVLARIETGGINEVALARSSWFTGKATRIDRSLVSPVEHLLGRGLFTMKLTIDGESFFVPRPFRSRLASILGSPGR